MVSALFPFKMRAAELSRRGKRLLGPVDLELGPDGFTVVIGPNGSGKTSLLRVMHGLERLSAGSAAWQIEERAARARQAYVFQTPILLRRSVAQNLSYPLKLRGQTAQADLLRDWAMRIDLADALERSALRLSGGEKQKLALARALIVKPDVLFLDEPCANLDGRSTREIEALLVAAQSGGTRIIMATHDLGQARRLGSDAIFMLGGRVHERGNHVLSAPKTAEAQAFSRGDIIE